MQTLPEVKYACVAYTTEEPKKLLFFLILNTMLDDRQDSIHKGSELWQKMTCILSGHELPDEIRTVSEFPMTVHGKVDRSKLIQQHRAELEKRDVRTTTNCCVIGETYLVGQDFVVERMQHLWAGLLGVLPTNIHSSDNFIEKGGDSFTAVHLFEQIENTFRTVHAILYDKILHNTFSELCEYVLCTTNEKHWRTDITFLSDVPVVDDTDHDIALPARKRKKHTPGGETSNSITKEGKNVTQQQTITNIVSSVSAGRSRSNATQESQLSGTEDDEYDQRTVLEKQQGCFQDTEKREVIRPKRREQYVSSWQRSSRSNGIHDLLPAVYCCYCQEYVSFMLRWKYNTGKCVDASPMVAMEMYVDN